MLNLVIEKQWEVLTTVFLIVFIEWSIVWASIGIDLHYGIKKSKSAGILTTFSAGLRRTSTKVKEYSTVLLFALFLDFLNPVTVYFDIPPFPIASTLASLFLVLTEFISVREGIDQKLNKDLKANTALFVELLKNDKAKEIINKLLEDKK